jgi:hypothetical protein
MWAAPGVFGYSAVAFVANFSGAVGDLWFVAMMTRFRSCADLWLVDIADRLAVYSPDPAAAIIATRIEQRSVHLAWPVQLFFWWIGIAGALFGATPPVLGVLNSWGVKDVAIGLPGHPLVGTTPDGFFVDLVPFLATCFLMAVPATIAGRRFAARARRHPTVVDAPRSGAPRPALL